MLFYTIAAVAALVIIAAAAYLGRRIFGGNAVLIVDKSVDDGWHKAAQDDNSLTVRRRFAFRNIGRQCCTVADCLARPQLPYEQYDGVAVRGKAERVGEVREDDYFEAVLVQKGEAIEVDIVLTFAARKNQTIAEAMRHMVDMPIDVIYTFLSRTPYEVRKERFTIAAEEAAGAAGVELAPLD